MDGDSVRERKRDRNIHLEYSFDRLIDKKMIQVYQLLVPDKAWKKDVNEQDKNREYATSEYICEGVIGPSKRRAHD